MGGKVPTVSNGSGSWAVGKALFLDAVLLVKTLEVCEHASMSPFLMWPSGELL